MNPIVIRLGRLGDMTLLAPLLHCIHMRYGERCILIGPGDYSVDIYAAHPDVARVWPVTQRHHPPPLSLDFRRIARALKQQSGPVYVCETEPRALAKIRWLLARAGVSTGRVVYLTDDLFNGTEHWTDRLQRFATTTPAEFSTEYLRDGVRMAAPPGPRLYVNEPDRIDRDRWLQQRGFAGSPLVLVQAANKRTMRWNGRRAIAQDSKFWPVSAWSELLHAVHATLPDAVLLLCGSRREAALLESMRREIAIDRLAVAARDLPLRRLMALMEIAHSMISVDTGPAHLAAAMGCPEVVLFGACSPAHWLPRSAVGSAVIGVGGAPQFARADQIEPVRMIEAWRQIAAASGHRSRAQPAGSTLTPSKKVSNF